MHCSKHPPIGSPPLSVTEGGVVRDSKIGARRPVGVKERNRSRGRACGGSRNYQQPKRVEASCLEIMGLHQTSLKNSRDA